MSYFLTKWSNLKCFDELHKKHLSTRDFHQNVFVNKKLHAILLIFKALVRIYHHEGVFMVL